MIKIYCDFCGQEAKDKDFAGQLLVVEVVTSLEGKDFTPLQQKQKRELHICKGCFYSHINKHIKNAI